MTKDNQPDGRELSPVEWLLQEIDQCNQELRRLEGSPDEANQRVSAEPWLYSEQIKISYKNKVQLQRETHINKLRGYLSNLNLGVRSNLYPPSADSTVPRYLAFIDILGFSAIVKKNTHAELGGLVDTLIRDIQKALAPEVGGNAKAKLQTNGNLAFDLDDATINTILLSDTIIFWSKDDSIESFLELTRTIQRFMHFEVYYSNIALRGAITVGQFSYNDLRVSHQQLVVDQSTIYGEAIVEAYRLEGIQEWLGCIVTQEAVNHFLSQLPPQEMIDNVLAEYLIKYPVPVKPLGTFYQKTKKWLQNLLKKQPIYEDYVIKWPRVWETEDGPKAIRRCFTRYQKLNDIPKRPDIQRKYSNTVKFAEHIIQASGKEVT